MNPSLLLGKRDDTSPPSPPLPAVRRPRRNRRSDDRRVSPTHGRGGRRRLALPQRRWCRPCDRPVAPPWFLVTTRAATPCSRKGRGLGRRYATAHRPHPPLDRASSRLGSSRGP